MRNDLQHLDFTFPSIPVGEGETSPSLRKLLYKGGASLPVDKANEAIEKGLLGHVLPDRVALVSKIHEAINGTLVGGGSAQTAREQIAGIARFVAWAESAGAVLTLSDVQNTYVDWAEHLLHRATVVKNVSEKTIHHYAAFVGSMLDRVLERATPMIGLTRIRKPAEGKKPQGTQADKQNLQTTFAFGHLLQDICDGLPLKVIRESYVVRIPLQQGGEIELRMGERPLPEELRQPSNVRRSKESALAYAADPSLDQRFRRDMVNLRILAELLMFIGQTGINLTQAQGLPLKNFSYSSDIDGYKVREYKKRRGGDVLFEIFREYRSHFERYLDWRRQLFPKEKRLFPLIRPSARDDAQLAFNPIKTACKQAGVAWACPRMLRNTRVNWLLRRSGDPDMTAEMAQHSKQMLLTVYQIPSQQRAMSEVTRFWQNHDPALAGEVPLLAVAPGECDGKPKAAIAKPQSAPAPDCRRPSGCLWCEQYRDVDTFDYVWSLACFRHLKVLEVSKLPPERKEGAVIHPAKHVIQKISGKLTWFRESNNTRREWVEESLLRVEEGHYYKEWSFLIEAVEGPFNESQSDRAYD